MKEQLWNDMYYKNQYFAIIFFLCGFLFTICNFYRNSIIEKTQARTSYKVLKQDCRKSNSGSSIHVKYKNKIYFIRLSIKECSKYPVGSSIKLCYDNFFDYFYLPDGLKTERKRMIFLLFCFLLSIIPYKKSRWR